MSETTLWNDLFYCCFSCFPHHNFTYILYQASSNCSKKKKGQFGNSPDFCVDWERKDSEGRALRKRGQSPQKGNETNGFEMLFYGMRFFSADAEHGTFHCAGLLSPHSPHGLARGSLFQHSSLKLYFTTQQHVQMGAESKPAATLHPPANYLQGDRMLIKIPFKKKLRVVFNLTGEHGTKGTRHGNSRQRLETDCLESRFFFPYFTKREKKLWKRSRGGRKAEAWHSGNLV